MSAVHSLILRFLQGLSLFIVIKPAKAGQICVCARSAESRNIVILGANVVCWDDDWNNDDWMASSMTESNSCAALSYETKSSRWCRGWDGCRTNLDIKCEVSGTCLQPIYTDTRNNIHQRNTAHFMVNVDANSDFCNDNIIWNGCGVVPLPDFLIDVASEFFGFREMCDTHDACLSNYQKTRHACDQEFINEIHGECNDDDYHFGDDALCQFLATLYGNAVTQLGGAFCHVTLNPQQ